MPRLEKTKQGVPERRGTNPFTRETMVFRGAPGWTRFWEFATRGSTLAARYGERGKSAIVSTRPCASAEEARRLCASLVAGRRAHGWRAVRMNAQSATRFPRAARRIEPIHAGLEATIVHAPEDPRAYQILGDWLEERGEPRADLIAAERARDPSRATTDVLARHADALLGPLAAHCRTQDGTDRPAFRWRFGFIEAAHLSYDDSESQEPVDVARIAHALLTHPSARFLRELSLGRCRSGFEWSYDDVLTMIALNAPRTLRRLVVGDFAFPEETELSWAKVGHAGALWRMVPSLEDVTLQGADVDLGVIVAPALRRFEVRTTALSRAAIAAIGTADWPRIESMIIWLGATEDVTVDDLAAVLRGAGVPGLRHLGLANCRFSDELVTALAGSRILPQLQTLDLSKGTLSATGARRLVRHAKRFRHLRQLMLSESFLDADACRSLAHVCAHVDTSAQRAPSDHRYVAVAE